MNLAESNFQIRLSYVLKNSGGAVALRKMIEDIVGINHSSILYLVYVLLSATAPAHSSVGPASRRL